MTLPELLYKLERDNAPIELIQKVKRDIEKLDQYRINYGKNNRLENGG